MASEKAAKVNSYSFDAKAETVTFSVTLPNRSYATRKVGDKSIPVKATVTFVGTRKLSEVLVQMAEQDKLALAARNRATANKNTNDKKAEDEMLFRLIEQMNGQEVDVNALEVIPDDLKELLSDEVAKFHDIIRATYSTHGYDLAKKVAVGLGWTEPDEEA